MREKKERKRKREDKNRERERLSGKTRERKGHTDG